MANEAVIIELMGEPKGRPVRFTVADGTTISGGTLLAMQDPRTAVANSGAAQVFCGVLAQDKIANDGQTSVAAYTCGIFDLKVTSAGTAATLGAALAMSGANLVRNASEAEIAAGACVGKALEDGSSSEVIAVAIGVYVV